MSSWPQVRLGDLIDPQRPITYGVVQPGDHIKDGIPLVRGGDFSFGWKQLSEYRRVAPEIERSFARARLKAGDLVITIKGDVGTAAIVPDFLEGANISQTNARIAVASTKADARYVLAFLQSNIGREQIAAATQIGAQPGLIFRDIENFSLNLPPLAEQRRIVAILQSWDDAIDAAERLVEARSRLLEQLSLRVLEKHYTQHDELRSGAELFVPRAERGRLDLPLLAVMQDIGVVRRDELDRRVVMPEGDTLAYKAVHPGDFVISLRSFEGGVEYSYIAGLVSPAYTVMHSKVRIEANYYRFLFKSRSFIGRLDRIIFGIRDGKQISFADFSELILPCPPLREQQAAVEVLAAATENVSATKRHRDALQRQKLGLVQKLLTGEWSASASEDAA